MKTSLKTLILTWNAVSPKIIVNERVYTWNHKVNISLFTDEMFVHVENLGQLLQWRKCPASLLNIKSINNDPLNQQ